VDIQKLREYNRGAMSNIDAKCTTPSPPMYILVQSNLTCNQRCQHCHLWRNTDPEGKAAQYEALRLQAVREVAEISPRATVITCGGEPLSEPRLYFNLCGTAREVGLTSMSVLNGTLTETQAAADELLTRGADEISLSLDHPREGEHDMMRGKRGAWQKTTRCLSMLLDARRRLGLPRKLYVMLMVAGFNYRYIEEAYELVLGRIGADKLKLNFLQPTISATTKRDAFWDMHTRNVDRDELLRTIDRCESRYALDFNPRWKDCVRVWADSLARYHRGGPAETTVNLCNSFDRNVVVEVESRMRLCFHSKFPGTVYRERGDLRKFWYAPETAALRVSMRECRDFCGICHTFKEQPATREAARRILGE
jgi:MoaA/NifB/PqqE/SkfB family radical SAM enzyme